MKACLQLANLFVETQLSEQNLKLHGKEWTNVVGGRASVVCDNTVIRVLDNPSLYGKKPDTFKPL